MIKTCIYEVDYGNCIEGIADKEFKVIPRIGELINLGQKYYEVIMVNHELEGKKFEAQIFVKHIESDARFPYLPPRGNM